MTSTSAGGSRDQRLPRSWRITRNSEIRSLLRWGERSRTDHLDVFSSASPKPYPRAGVIVPRYRRRIVERNLLKRRLREIVRRLVLPRLRDEGRSLDLLVRARREAYTASYRELSTEVERWLQRVGERESSSS